VLGNTINVYSLSLELQNMSVVAHTSVNYVSINDDERAVELSDAIPRLETADQPLRIAPVRVQLRDIVLTGKILGCGAYSAAFPCTVWNRVDCVVKLPYRNYLRPEGFPIPLSEVWIQEASSRSFFYGRYEKELSISRRLLDPIGAPIAETTLTVEEARTLARAHRKMREHPGFHHVHRVLHVELEFPFLLSERCDTTAAFLGFTQYYDPSTSSERWRRVAHQSWLGFDYMVRGCGLVNTDLHTSNIYATAQGDNVYNYKLADYDQVRPVYGKWEQSSSVMSGFRKMLRYLFILAGTEDRHQPFASWLQWNRKQIFKEQYHAFAAWAERGEKPEGFSDSWLDSDEEESP